MSSHWRSCVEFAVISSGGGALLQSYLALRAGDATLVEPDSVGVSAFFYFFFSFDPLYASRMCAAVSFRVF